MSAVRVLSTTGVGVTATRVRVLSTAGQGTVVVIPTVRVLSTRGEGIVVPVIVPPTARTIGPGEVVTLTWALADGSTADSWVISRVSGPAATVTGSGTSRTITGPASIWGSSAQVLRLRAITTRAGLVSAPAYVDLTCLPQTVFVLESAGWRGAVTAPA